MPKCIHPPPPPLHPFLVDLNTEMGNVGVQHGEHLWFYTPKLAYKTWIKKNKYWCERESLIYLWYGPEKIPLVSGAAINDVLAVLRTEAMYLTPEEAAIVWKDQHKNEKLAHQFENAFES